MNTKVSLNSNTKMEAETISKNGVSLKSQTSKRNLMSQFFCFAMVAMAIVSFASCEKENGDDNGTEIESGGFDGKITATVSTGDVAVDEVKFIDTETDEYITLAVGEYKNGGFTLSLPTTVPAQCLYLIASNAPSGTKVSDKNVKVTSFESGESIYAFKDGVEVGYFYYRYDNNDDDTYEIVCSFMYADRDVTITGSITGGHDGWIEIENYNVSLKKGWNKMYHKSIKSETNKTRTDEYTTVEQSGMKWYFRD